MTYRPRATGCGEAVARESIEDWAAGREGHLSRIYGGHPRPAEVTEEGMRTWAYWQARAKG